MHVKNIFNLQYDYKFISSGGCTSVLPDGGSLSVGVPLFVLSSAVLPNVSVFAFSVSKRSGNVPPFPSISLRRASSASFVLI